ncbi:uncharacterized protein A4U43_C07F36070 [Asparagus officinalis]|uniref:Purple acid phosphatase n=1 Tax=Asparagus officinalis TaxID=4686 RepID=A0A5P1EHG4_ASPOF|nr:purple acid phosphatase 17-like [Asparagus officinalis]ONK65336.1 uncharacterized protein A4U43_C07F36070 [Asparagus officinalis]
MANINMKAMAYAFMLAFAIPTLILSPRTSAELKRFQQEVKGDGSLSFLAVGDWGRRGYFNQSLVASQMGKTGKRLGVDFVISTGDNFYDNGLTGVDDKLFEESFTNVYTAKSLQKTWYSVLGNHDYRGDVLAQLSPVLRQVDSRWFCMRSFILDTEIAEFFFVDTTPFVNEYWVNDGGHSYDWRQVAPRENYVSSLLKDLDMALKQSTATWKFVIGHHAIRSVSEHGDTPELIEHLLPILEANGVDFYINGHDHCLEHISSNDSPIQYLVSGGGSKAWRGVYKPNKDKVQFFYDGQGFMSMELTKIDAKVTFYDAFGNNLHEFSMTKDMHPTL